VGRAGSGKLDPDPRGAHDRDEVAVKKPDRRLASQPPPSLERRTAERRRADRILVDLKVDFCSQDMFLYAFVADLSALGLFILSGNPHPVGSKLRLNFFLPGDEQPLEAEGVVRWVSPIGPTPGMGVEFTSIAPDVVEKLTAVLEQLAHVEPAGDTPRR
jgi:uncharacterized protein (TIGR02266 family)